MAASYPAPPHIRGVNLGGWLVLEPWITPNLFKTYGNESTVDEWTLCQHLGRAQASRMLEKHYASFVTKDDLKQLADSGITHIRIPVGYWATSIEPGEPYVAGAWRHMLRIIQLAGESFNLKVLVDLHGVPGSQNGFDNSGKRGPIEWQADPRRVERTLAIWDTMAKSLAQPHIVKHVWGVQLVNEPANWGLDMGKLRQFYLDGYKVVRRHLPPQQVALVIHDAFLGADKWLGFMPSPAFENVVLDVHFYHVFTDNQLAMTPEQHVQDAQNTTITSSLWTIVGEWSLATTDCAPYLNGWGVGARWDGTHPSRQGKGPIHPGASCKDKMDKAFLRTFFKAQAQAYAKHNGWFFWNFKADDIEWSYLDILKHAVIP